MCIQFCSLYYFYFCNFSVCLKIFMNKKVGFFLVEAKVVVLQILMSSFTAVPV